MSPDGVLTSVSDAKQARPRGFPARQHDETRRRDGSGPGDGT